MSFIHRMRDARRLSSHPLNWPLSHWYYKRHRDESVLSWQWRRFVWRLNRRLNAEKS